MPSEVVRRKVAGLLQQHRKAGMSDIRMWKHTGMTKKELSEKLAAMRRARKPMVEVLGEK